MNKLSLKHLTSLFKLSSYRRLSSVPETITNNSLANQQNDFKQPQTVTTNKYSVFEPCDDEDVSHVAPYLKPSFNFAAYVNKSVTLQELLKLGVDLHKLEKKQNVPEYILGLQFETDIKEHVMFLNELGLSVEEVGAVISKNPFIFKETLENLKVRVNYLQSKKFTQEMIVRIIRLNAFWLSFSTRDMDKMLGYFQKTFSLTGSEVRLLATKQPKLITYSKGHLKKSVFVLKEEMGFNPDECKKIILEKPRILMNEHKKITSTFEYLHTTMQIPTEMIVQMPEILTCRAFRLQQRYEYLQKLGKIQFNPKLPGYISPLEMVSGTDGTFTTNVAKTSIESYNTFLKTL